MRSASWISWIGMGFFLSAVSLAAIQYPGGNRFDGQFQGYSFFGNFLCDLFDPVAYNRSPNPGRPFAIFGTYSLAVSLAFFWALLPELFKDRPKARPLVRAFGISAMLISLLIATRLHDLSIIVATPLGMSAFLISIFALFKSGKKSLAWLGVLALGICLLNYLSFVFQIFPKTLPGVQKAALIGFLTWVIAAMIQLKTLRRLPF